MRRAVIGGIGLALPAAVMVVVAWKAHERATAAPDPPAVGEAPVATKPVTPVLSLRRSPITLAAKVRQSNFNAAMSPVTTAVQERACIAVAVDGRTLVADNAETAFIPASNTKLLTAAVALEVLGPDHTFVTEARGQVSADGIVPRLVLVGGGDPLLSTSEYPSAGLNTYAPFNTTSLEQLADAVAATGARTVLSLVADESRYDTQRDAPGWGNVIESGDVSLLSALMVDDGYTSLSGGDRAASSAAGALEVFQGMLERRDIEIVLSAEGTAEGEPVLSSVQSMPLSAIVNEMLLTSDNVTAELLLKEIGLVATGVGSTSAGASVVADRVASWGVTTEGLVLRDGSGLSGENRISCATLVGVLAHVGPQGPVFDGLPVAGQSGTLSQFFRDTPAAGVLRAKTGSLSVARALSGFFPGDDGSMLEFSFLVNGEGAKGRAERLWDDIAEALDSYPQGPSPEELAPAPPTAG